MSAHGHDEIGEHADPARGDAGADDDQPPEHPAELAEATHQDTQEPTSLAARAAEEQLATLRRLEVPEQRSMPSDRGDPSDGGDPPDGGARSGAGTPTGPVQALKDVMEEVRKTYVFAVVLVCMVNLVAILLFASGQPGSTWTPFSVGVMTFAAASITGGLLGFLFALPRSVTNDGRTQEVTGHTVRPNTNLEDVSDWVTKIIVGLSLIHIVNARDALVSLSATVGAALGGGDAAAPFAGALIVFSAAFGIMGGWVATRLFIGRMMQAADSPQSPRLEAQLTAENMRHQHELARLARGQD